MIDLSDKVQEIVHASGIVEGICVLYVPHTTAGICINEGADPDVRRDLLAALDQVAPAEFPYRHREGNSQAHLMALLTGASVTFFFNQGRLQLGAWQRIFFCEFDGPRRRSVWWRLHSGSNL